MSWQPKLRPKGFPHSIDDFAVASLSELEHRSRTDEKRDQRVFRVKRKHVLKACDRCRVKKTKVCYGINFSTESTTKQYRSVMANSHAIDVRYIIIHVFFVSEKQHRPKCTLEELIRFVEMLESHHSLVVKALQKLYKFCVNNEGFPGEPLAEAPDGHPLTHAILDRLGLIKQAEENADEPDEDSEDLRYLRLLSTSTECSATAEPSPEPTTPPELSSATLSRPSICIPMTTPPMGQNPPSWQWDMQSVQSANYSYPDTGYQNMVPMPRSSLNSVDLSSNDISPHNEISAGSGSSGLGSVSTSAPSISHSQHPNDQEFPYYMDGGGSAAEGQADIKFAVRMHPGIIPDHSHHSAHLSAELLGDFHFQAQDSPFFPGFTPGWSFPSG
ncbi:hypothetical protein N7495_002230 [Penicillium taxi]|uniref:uncharacterized protein n=1 Tax=Penicillium taxi TaxID=168475 RepID=UPI002545817C|nr:uncharacterized protein N7495_002230 [Penicillium taxi]KAJ5901702.1 hypothetical protein N7495_002230 [Penicillium taxi]